MSCQSNTGLWDSKVNFHVLVCNIHGCNLKIMMFIFKVKFILFFQESANSWKTYQENSVWSMELWGMTLLS